MRGWMLWTLLAALAFGEVFGQFTMFRVSTSAWAGMILQDLLDWAILPIQAALLAGVLAMRSMSKAGSAGVLILAGIALVLGLLDVAYHFIGLQVALQSFHPKHFSPALWATVSIPGGFSSGLGFSAMAIAMAHRLKAHRAVATAGSAAARP